jgi:hypothetical protein
MILLYFLLVLACLGVAVSSLAARGRGWRPSIEPRLPELIAAWATLISAVGVSGWLIFMPAVVSHSTTVAADAATATAEQRLTLLEAGQLAILPILAVVVALAASPIILQRRRVRYWAEVWGALILAAFSLLAGFSIGFFLLPVAGLMLVAALLGRASDRTA